MPAPAFFRLGFDKLLRALDSALFAYDMLNNDLALLLFFRTYKTQSSLSVFIVQIDKMSATDQFRSRPPPTALQIPNSHPQAASTSLAQCSTQDSAPHSAHRAVRKIGWIEHVIRICRGACRGSGRGEERSRCGLDRAHRDGSVIVGGSEEIRIAWDQEVWKDQLFEGGSYSTVIKGV